MKAVIVIGSVVDVLKKIIEEISTVSYSGLVFVDDGSIGDTGESESPAIV